jgi:hypothetical protein
MGGRTAKSKPKAGARAAPRAPKTSKAGRMIIAGLEEAAAHMRGEHVPGLVVHKPLARRYIKTDGEVRELDAAFFAKAKRGRPPMAAGRKKVRMNFMIDPDLAAALDKRANKSAVVNKALRKVLGPA